MADDVTVEEVAEEVIEEVVETEAVETEEVEAEPEATEEEEMTVSFGEDSPPQEEEEKAPEWVRELRKKNSATNKRNKELEERLAQYEKKETTVLGPKPTLESSDYDSEQYDKDLAAWYEKKSIVEKEQAVVEQSEASQEKAWQGTLSTHREKATELKAKVGGYEEAEAMVSESLSTIQQSIILKQAKNSAHFILALGKDPKSLEKLSSLEDPADFLWEAAQMETRMKVGSRKAVTSPEKTVNSGGGSANMGDATLEKLEKAAAKSGDRTKVIAYKRSKRK